ncbi:uncharacterized protein EV422DRAFT_509062 [Fimicolochytrium jonesii]|uniref:uncharacterized protein n=1 Tax=Fimicolochytrium jonesii TaxID=1396493 RepID=UPI0022FE1504|nr:uncharacterized protein EV422DRAFT_509062 [Fimicolochytrium jonesii]KAI8817221.1 hypothetical protein EV422DRAFT_509062 [Fimicolochytrium jonesii]
MYFGNAGVTVKAVKNFFQRIGNALMVCEKPKALLERFQLFFEGTAHFNALLVAKMKASYTNVWERQLGSDFEVPSLGPIIVGLLPVHIKPTLALFAEASIDAKATGEVQYGFSVTQTLRVGYKWEPGPKSSRPMVERTFDFMEHPFVAATQGTAELKLKLKPRLLLTFDPVLRTSVTLAPYVGVGLNTNAAVKQQGEAAFFFNLSVQPFYGMDVTFWLDKIGLPPFDLGPLGKITPEKIGRSTLPKEWPITLRLGKKGAVRVPIPGRLCPDYPITVTSPNTTSKLLPGKTFNITWLGGDPYSTVSIQIRTSVLAPWQIGSSTNGLPAGPVPNTGFCAWTVPASLISGKNYQLGVISGRSSTNVISRRDSTSDSPNYGINQGYFSVCAPRSSSAKCVVCNSGCEGGCTDSSAKSCVDCKNMKYDGFCVAECPVGTQAGSSKNCIPIVESTSATASAVARASTVSTTS